MCWLLSLIHILVLIAARPSMGKTTFSLNIAENAALKEGKSVVIFSLEMSKEQLAYKLLCSQANVDMLKLRTGNLEDDDWERIATVSYTHLDVYKRQGYSCNEVDDELRKKLKLGIAEEHEYEKEGKSLTKLQNHIKGRY